MTEWNVQKDTLLFKDLTLAQANELLRFSYEVQFIGLCDFEHPAVVAWFKAGNFTDNSRLLIYATVFAPRAALSAAQWFKKAYLTKQSD